MPKFRYRLIFALIFSPMLASTTVAQEELTETLKSSLTSILSKKVQVIESKETPLSITDKVKGGVDSVSKIFQVESKETKSQLKDALSQTKKSAVSSLMSVEKFKICSLGHNYNISNYEFIKQQQVEQSNVTITYKSQEDNKYNCEVNVVSDQAQNVELKCWKGFKAGSNLAVFKLSYLVGDSYMFVQPGKGRLVLVKPINHGTVNSCPDNFKPIAQQKTVEKPVLEKKPTGLAGLTF